MGADVAKHVSDEIARKKLSLISFRTGISDLRTSELAQVRNVRF